MAEVLQQLLGWRFRASPTPRNVRGAVSYTRVTPGLHPGYTRVTSELHPGCSGVTAASAGTPSVPSLSCIPSSSRGNPSACSTGITSTHSIWKGQGEERELLGASCLFWGLFFPPPCSSTLSCSASSFCHELFQPPFPISRFPGVPARISGCRGSVVGPAWAQGSPAAPRWNFHCGWGVLTSVIHRLGRGSAFPSLPRGSGQVFAPVGSSWSRTCARGPSTQRPK